MSGRTDMPSGRRTLPPLEFRGAAPFGQTVALAARSAFASLGVHKLRAALTMVGIVIGVAGVFTIINLALLARSQNARGIGGLGANVIEVNGFSIPSTAPPITGSGPVRAIASGPPSLTTADVQALQKLPHVVGVNPLTGTKLQVQAADRNWNTQLFGSYPDIQITQGYNVQQGGFFTQADVTSGNTVAVLGQTVAKQLFPSGNAVGQQVRIGNVDFSVVGVLKPLGGSGRTNLDDVVVVPISTYLQRIVGPMQMTTGNAPKSPDPPNATVIHLQGSADANPALKRTNFPDVQVAVDDPGNVETVTSAITQTLRQTHGIKPGSEDDFTVGGFLKGTEAAQQGATTILWVMGAIAAVALLIGGFGVANVMLAAVAERRVEIGVRLAVGADVQDIFWQFLLEALTLSAAGGILGVLGGVGLSLALPLSGKFPGLQVAPSWLEVAVALVASIAIGLAFGAYPARRAARTDPIQALQRG